MKCCSEDQPNCRHLEKCRENWDCSVSVYERNECNYYETEAEHEFLQKMRDIDVNIEEFGLEKTLSYGSAYILGFVAIVYALTLWWILS